MTFIFTIIEKLHHQVKVHDHQVKVTYLLYFFDDLPKSGLIYIQGESEKKYHRLFFGLVAYQYTKIKIVIWFDNVFSFRYNFCIFHVTLLVIKLHTFAGSLCFFAVSTKPVFFPILYFSQFDPPAMTMVSLSSK